MEMKSDRIKYREISAGSICLPPAMGDGSRHGISRRAFLTGAIAAGGCLAALAFMPRQNRVAARTGGENLDDYCMLMDISRCIGCRRCEAACNRANDLPAPAVSFEDKSVLSEHRRTDEITYTVVNRYADPRTGGPVYLKTQCNHCIEPACASVCLVGALQKSPEGPVIYDESLCVGCRYCMVACPFYIPTFEYDDVSRPAIQKCFMCYSNRLLEGEVPACAVECPVEAITFGRRSEVLNLARQRILGKPNKYVDHIYGEHEAGGLGWLYISAVPFEDMGFPADLDTTPAPNLTREFLSSVPLVLIIWPAMLAGFYLVSKKRNGTENGETTEKHMPHKHRGSFDD